MKRPHHALFVLCLLFLSTSSLLAEDKKPPDETGLPDLILSPDLGKQWVVRDENLKASFCSVQGTRPARSTTSSTSNPGWREVTSTTSIPPINTR